MYLIKEYKIQCFQTNIKIIQTIIREKIKILNTFFLKLNQNENQKPTNRPTFLIFKLIIIFYFK